MRDQKTDELKRHIGQVSLVIVEVTQLIAFSFHMAWAMTKKLSENNWLFMKFRSKLSNFRKYINSVNINKWENSLASFYLN